MPEDLLTRLQRIVQTAESGRWPQPEEIDILQDAHEQSLQRSRRYEGRPSVSEVPEPLRSEMSEWSEQGLLIARALHALASQAGLSIEETAELTGGHPIAFGRLRARAALENSAAKAKSRHATPDDEGVVWQGKRFPGCLLWSNWGFGMDQKGDWHLFHRQQATRAGDSAVWRRNPQAPVRFAKGLMTRLAKELAEVGVITEGAFAQSIKPGVSRLRSRLSEILQSIGYQPEGDPLPYDAEKRAWRPLVRFGTAELLDSRHWRFRPIQDR